MHLHKTSESRLIAELTQEDLHGYRVTFEEMRMENEQTVHLLHDILTRAKTTLGWTNPAARMLRVDVLPGSGGGCIVLLSSTAHEKRLLVKAENRTLLLHTQSTDDFLDLLLQLKAGLFSPSAYTFYKDGDRFAGVFRFASVLETRRAAMRLSEYGTLCRVTPQSLAYLKEHAAPVRLRQAP